MVEEMLASLDKRVTRLESDVPILAALKIQMDACELMHQEGRAVAERTEAALNNNTKASEEQTKAITDLTIIVRSVVEKVEKDHDPVVIRSRYFQRWWDNVCIWFEFNQNIAKWIIGILLTSAGVAAALKTLGWW